MSTICEVRVNGTLVDYTVGFLPESAHEAALRRAISQGTMPDWPRLSPLTAGILIKPRIGGKR